MSMWCFVALALTSIYCLFFWSFQPLQRRIRRLPPGPRGLPLVGNLFHLGFKPNVSLQLLSHKYGPIMSLFFGMKTVVVVSSAELAREVLKTHDKSLSGRDVMATSTVMGNHKRSLINGQPDAQWRFLRKICVTELFSTRKLTELHHTRREEICKALQKLIVESSDGKRPVNIRDFLLIPLLSTLGKTIFSTDMFSTESQSFKDFKENFAKAIENAVRPTLVDLFPILRPLDPLHVLRDTEFYTKKVGDMLDVLIQTRIKSPDGNDNSRKDFLDTLLPFSGPDFTLSDIRILFLDLFGAGGDTSLITVEWAMAELIRNPRVMAKAQSELDEVVGKSRILEESDFENLPYLRATVKETFRVHPVAPLLGPHRALEKTQVGGFVIPKNATVVVNFWAITRDPCVWDEAEEFIPERFLHSDIDYKGNHLEFIPFGAGRRMCPGMPLASLMIHSMLGCLVHGFTWSLPDGVEPEEIDMSEKFGTTFHKATPLVAVAVPRLPPHVYKNYKI